MKTLSIKKVAFAGVIICLISSPFLSLNAMLVPFQGTSSSVPQSSAGLDWRTDYKTVKLTENSLLASNTIDKADNSPVSASSKAPKHDKKTISRCWKRLMTMVREVSYTHRKNTK